MTTCSRCHVINSQSFIEVICLRAIFSFYLKNLTSISLKVCPLLTKPFSFGLSVIYFSVDSMLPARYVNSMRLLVELNVNLTHLNVNLTHLLCSI